MISSSTARIVISPHLDDGVFSLGGTIARWCRRGIRVTVVTVFAGSPTPGRLSPFARRLHAWWSIRTPGERREEDRCAATILRADIVHCDFLDAIYREYDGQFAYPTHDSLFELLLDGDRRLVGRVAERLSETIEGLGGGAAPQIHAPSSVGDHVDHRITREAAALVADRTGVPIHYYVDLPYGLQEPSSSSCWRASHFSHTDLERKLEAVTCYESQTRTDRGPLVESLRLFALRRGGRPAEDHTI